MGVRTGPLTKLRLEPAGPDRWSAAVSGVTDRITPGLLGAQAVVASGGTVDTRWRWAHAIRVTCLDQGDPGVPVEHRVERTHDTEHAAVRLIRFVQEGIPLAVTTVTFATPRHGPGLSYPSVWIHRGFRAGDWLLHEHESPSAADYRALTTGRFISSMGRLVASASRGTALLPVADPPVLAAANAGP